MPLFGRIKTWTSEVLTAADLNAEFDNTNLKASDPTYIEDASTDVTAMQSTVSPGAVGTESLATNILGEVQRLRYVIKRLVGAQWYTDPGRSLQASSLAVQTADIAALAVTRAKLAAVGQQVSSSSAAFSTSNTSATDVTNLSVSITTTGRPVYLCLVDSGSGAAINARDSALQTVSGTMYFVRGATTLSATLFGTDLNSSGGAITTNTLYPPGCFNHVDVVAAGTYTYKAQVACTSGATTVFVTNCLLVAFEL